MNLKKINWGLVLLIFIIFFYLYKFLKYGLIGYFQKRQELKQERRKKVFNSLFLN